MTTLKKLGFEEQKGQLREWMTVPIARDGPTWGIHLVCVRVEYRDL
jgi:hypothetical protein